MSKGHGGRRPNQTGRPRLASKKVRIGTLFLSPATVKALADRTRDKESLIQAAARLLTDHLAAPDPEESGHE